MQEKNEGLKDKKFFFYADLKKFCMSKKKKRDKI